MTVYICLHTCCSLTFFFLTSSFILKLISKMASSSWIEIRSDCDFSLDNIPFGVASSNRKNCGQWYQFSAMLYGNRGSCGGLILVGGNGTISRG